MNREEFNNLDPMAQINYINQELNNNFSLTHISKNIGISRRTIRDKFKKKGYIFDKESNNYIYSTNVIIEENNNSPIKSNNYESNNIESADNNYFYIIKVIEEMNNKLDEVYTWYENQKNVIEPIELKINKFEGEALNRTFKIYPKVQEEFKDFCNKYREYKVQDIISQAIHEFMQKYK